MSIDAEAAVLGALTITGCAALLHWGRKAATTIITSFRDATRFLAELEADEAHNHPPQQAGSHAAAGPHPVPGQPSPGGPQKVHGHPAVHAPAPAITLHEAAFLAAMGRLRTMAQPGQVMAGREIADGLRVRVPGVDDWTLGVITLDLLGYIKAMAFGLPDAEHAIQCAMDAFGLCAEELTRLDRNGVPR